MPKGRPQKFDPQIVIDLYAQSDPTKSFHYQAVLILKKMGYPDSKSSGSIRKILLDNGVEIKCQKNVKERAPRYSYADIFEAYEKVNKYQSFPKQAEELNEMLGVDYCLQSFHNIFNKNNVEKIVLELPKPILPKVKPAFKPKPVKKVKPKVVKPKPVPVEKPKAEKPASRLDSIATETKIIKMEKRLENKYERKYAKLEKTIAKRDNTIAELRENIKLLKKELNNSRGKANYWKRKAAKLENTIEKSKSIIKPGYKSQGTWEFQWFKKNFPHCDRAWFSALIERHKEYGADIVDAIQASADGIGLDVRDIRPLLDDSYRAELKEYGEKKNLLKKT